MPLTHIEYGSLASSSVINNNFEVLSDKITTVSNNLTSTAASLNSNLSGINRSLAEQIEALTADISDLENDLNTLRDNFDSQNNSPDYSKGIAITLPYTVTQDGYVYAGVNGIDAIRYVYVNGSIVHGHCGYSGGYNVYSGSVFRVSTGDVVTCSSVMGNYYFYPIKGIS